MVYFNAQIHLSLQTPFNPSCTITHKLPNSLPNPCLAPALPTQTQPSSCTIPIQNINSVLIQEMAQTQLGVRGLI